MCGSSKPGTAIPTVYIDNQKAHVTKWRFKERGDGTIVTAPMKSGVPYYRELGVEHDVINENNFECAFVEIKIFKPE